MIALRSILVWTVLALGVVVPFLLAALSPLHAYRSLPYIAASLGGVLALGVLLIQPFLASGWLPGVGDARLKCWHRMAGTGLIVLVAVHVGGLLVASPPDAIDALLLRSPTPFSVWGVTAMWALLVTVVLVALKRSVQLRPSTWRTIHTALALVVVLGTVLHAVQITGTMETVSKWALCGAALLAALIAVGRVWRRHLRRRPD